MDYTACPPPSAAATPWPPIGCGHRWVRT